jgi:hypothetical protein
MTDKTKDTEDSIEGLRCAIERLAKECGFNIFRAGNSFIFIEEMEHLLLPTTTSIDKKVDALADLLKVDFEYRPEKLVAIKRKEK